MPSQQWSGLTVYASEISASGVARCDGVATLWVYVTLCTFEEVCNKNSCKKFKVFFYIIRGWHLATHTWCHPLYLRHWRILKYRYSGRPFLGTQLELTTTKPVCMRLNIYGRRVFPAYTCNNGQSAVPVVSQQRPLMHANGTNLACFAKLQWREDLMGCATNKIGRESTS